MDFRKVLEYTEDLKVLYVEDDEDLLEETVEILEDYFLLLDTAVNGQEGLDKYNTYFEQNNSYYDLIITDINMPIMDGEELIREVGRINIEQVIIVISAYSESSRLVGLIQKGISSQFKGIVSVFSPFFTGQHNHRGL